MNTPREGKARGQRHADGSPKSLYDANSPSTKIGTVSTLTLFLAGVLLPLFCFGWLAEAVWNRNGLSWDASALGFVHQFATPTRDSLMVAITKTGDVCTVVVLATAVGLGLITTKRPKAAYFLWYCIVGAGFTAYLVKLTIHRTRPHFWDSPAPETDFGFPSGHAVDSFAFAFGLAVIAWQTRRRWPVIFCGAAYVAAVGASRLYLGVHYPSDLMGAWALAATWLCGLLLVRWLARTNIIRWKKITLLASGVLAGVVTCLGAYIWSDLDHNNVRTLVPGGAYRAGHMSTNSFACWIETYGFKSVVNLRGESLDRDWYRGEIATAKAFNVAYFNFGMSARHELTDAEMTRLEQMLRDAPKPVLIHCDGGADRSALASAIYLYAIAGKTPAEAKRELSLWNGHLPILWPKVIAMDNSFLRYVTNHDSPSNPSPREATKKGAHE